MRVQLLLGAIPLIAGGDSSCHNSNKDFLCDDLSIYITTYTKEDGKDHYYVSGDSDGKGLHVVKGKTHSKMFKTGSKYWVQDQKDRYLEPHAGSQGVDLTNRGDEQGKWFLEYDSGNSERFNIYTDVNKATDDTALSETAQQRGSDHRRRRATNKNYLAYADRGTDIKLLEKGDASDREWWYIDPAYCAVIDPDKILGRWQHVKQIVHAGTETEKHGYNLHIDGSFHAEFSAKVKAVMKGGFNVGFAKKKMKLKAKLSADLVADIDADFDYYEEKGFTVPWKDEDVGKHLWQWVVDMTDQGGSPSGDCGKTFTLKTSEFRLTPGDADVDVPCCVPIGFHGDSWDTCTSTDTLIPGNSVCKVKKSAESMNSTQFSQRSLLSPRVGLSLTDGPKLEGVYCGWGPHGETDGHPNNAARVTFSGGKMHLEWKKRGDLKKHPPCKGTPKEHQCCLCGIERNVDCKDEGYKVMTRYWDDTVPPGYDVQWTNTGDKSDCITKAMGVSKGNKFNHVPLRIKIHDEGHLDLFEGKTQDGELPDGVSLDLRKDSDTRDCSNWDGHHTPPCRRRAGCKSRLLPVPSPEEEGPDEEFDDGPDEEFDVDEFDLDDIEVV